jgi:hypothetical protein
LWQREDWHLVLRVVWKVLIKILTFTVSMSDSVPRHAKGRDRETETEGEGEGERREERGERREERGERERKGERECLLVKAADHKFTTNTQHVRPLSHSK